MKIDFVSKLPSEGIGFLVWQKHGMQGELNLKRRMLENIFCPPGLLALPPVLGGRQGGGAGGGGAEAVLLGRRQADPRPHPVHHRQVDL